uniref:Uncharacterized protein n=1 Tax=Medicago truncatula TaxID=3880 RepID=A2Q1Z3_MEDTR|nr:hypothetical protein MtrDRAFT_AC149134g43v2 [Medicago truncatula]
MQEILKSFMEQGSWLYVLNVTITGHLYDKEANNQLEALGQRRKKKA